MRELVLEWLLVALGYVHGVNQCKHTNIRKESSTEYAQLEEGICDLMGSDFSGNFTHACSEHIHHRLNTQIMLLSVLQSWSLNAEAQLRGFDC